MRHLLVCPEYPPARPGGIGRYAERMARLLAEHGETVHVIAARWAGAEEPRRVACEGRLIVHRVPFMDPAGTLRRRPHRALSGTARALFHSEFHAQAFAWEAGELIERLVTNDAIDIIEAQEYQAPLYFVQLRRALAAAAGPPVLVHLHSPTEWIARHNDWCLADPPHVTAARLEEFSIRAADALVCPSAYCAMQVSQRYGLDGRVAVVPYPIAADPPAERSHETWSGGSVLCVGRLEGRKGVPEFLRAAALVAQHRPGVRFDVVGANILAEGWRTGSEQLAGLIPPALRDRFRIFGPRGDAELARLRAGARIAVVPSRWDNLPHTCLEAMASGLPVLATREGGMAELVEDGASGWLTPSPEAAALADALERALDTPPAQLAQMGALASATVRERCAPSRIVQAQLALRERVVMAGADASTRLPPLGPTSTVRAHAIEPLEGIAVIVTDGPAHDRATTMQAVGAQTRAPLTRHVAGSAAAGERLLQATSVPHLGVLFISAGETIEPAFLATAAGVLDRCLEVGMVSSWVRGEPGAAPHFGCNPSFPYQWLRHEAEGPWLVRGEALAAAGGHPSDVPERFARWELCNAIIAAGWSAVTIPGLLAASPGTCRAPLRSTRLRARLLARHPHLVARDAAAIALLAGAAPSLADLEALEPRLRIALLRQLARQPARTARWLLHTALESLGWRVAGDRPARGAR